MDNDKLRRQIAVLTSFIDEHSIGTDPIVADCYSQGLQEPMRTVHSTHTQTPNIVLENRNCGSDECLASNTAVVSCYLHIQSL